MSSSINLFPSPPHPAFLSEICQLFHASHSFLTGNSHQQDEVRINLALSPTAKLRRTHKGFKPTVLVSLTPQIVNPAPPVQTWSFPRQRRSMVSLLLFTLPLLGLLEHKRKENRSESIFTMCCKHFSISSNSMNISELKLYFHAYLLLIFVPQIPLVGSKKNMRFPQSSF